MVKGWKLSASLLLTPNSHGEPYRHFSAIIGWKALSDSVEHFGQDHEFTKLVINLKGKDPDDAFSSIPYEKGFNFLFHLETLLGKAKFDKFIPHVCRSPFPSEDDMLICSPVLHRIQREISRFL